MRMSLWENISFGLPKSKGIDNTEEGLRAQEVLRLFGDEHLATQLGKELAKVKRPAEGEEEEEEEEPSGMWQEKLTSLDRAIVHLARAFLMNPEILVLQRPLSNFATDRARIVLDNVFKGFVHKKGVCLPEAGQADRRPRTLFFVCESQEQAQVADVVWALEVKDKAVSKVTMNVQELADPKKMEFH